MPPIDRTEGQPTRQDSPATTAFVATPSDTVALPTITRALFVGSSGDLAVILKDDSTPATFKSLQAGTILPIRAKQVMATGTSCSDLVGLA